MSKKSKKRQSRSRRTSKQQLTSTMVSRKSISTAEDFNPDYSQTIKDLKRIGSLAGFFFVILIVLTFILH